MRPSSPNAPTRAHAARLPAQTGRTIVAALTSVIGGLAIAYLDSRPGYDDTGITAVLLISVAAVAAAIGSTRPWLWAILVSAWTPLIEISSGGSTGSLLAMVFAGLGASVGFLGRQASFRG